MISDHYFIRNLEIGITLINVIGPHKRSLMQDMPIPICSIIFRQGHESGRKTLNDVGDSERCQPGEEYAIIIHGWKESCQTEWVSLLASSRFTFAQPNCPSLPSSNSPFLFYGAHSDLTVYRGGCIICMDYSRYSRQAYMALFGMFDSISEVLAGKLRQLERQGLSPDQGFLFGFSYGGRLALEAAQRFGPKRMSQIDSKCHN